LVRAAPEDEQYLRDQLRTLSWELTDPLGDLFLCDVPEQQTSAAARALGEFADGVALLGILCFASPEQESQLYRSLPPLYNEKDHKRIGLLQSVVIEVREILAEAGVVAKEQLAPFRRQADLRQRGEMCDRNSNDRQPVFRESLADVEHEQPARKLSPLARVWKGKLRAEAAITLLRQERYERVFSILRVVEDPDSLTQFVHACRSRSVQPQDLLIALDSADKLRQTKAGEDRKREDRVLFGLLLALGEYRLEELPASVRRPLVERLAAWYASDPSSAIHGATGWLLRHWDQGELARQVDETPVAYLPDREWYTLAIPVASEDTREGETSIHFTFIVFPAGEYEIGEPCRRVRLTRGFALSDRPVA
jgi:hypothetical protein